MVLRELGARVWQDEGYLCASARRGLRGAKIVLPIRSTGATENAILCGCLAKGRTVIWNPHVRPELINLVQMLRTMGASIEVHGQQRIEVVGTTELRGASATIINDSAEAMTWLIAGTITGGDIEIQGLPAADLEVPLIHLRESGARFYLGSSGVAVRGGDCYPVDIATGPYPGINSDMQPLFAVYAACAKGESRITDLRFPDRYQYLRELTRMGVRAEVKNGTIHIHGGRSLAGRRVQALDLRAGAALVLAGMVASGTTRIADAWQIERGYDRFLEKLKDLRGDIEAR
jgi:UDP-N-acetylglucosamine 1-carboxyvinyltransferase